MRHRVAVIHHRSSFQAFDLFGQVSDIAEIVWVVADDDLSGPDEMRLLRRLGTPVDIRDLSMDDAAARLASERIDGIVTFVDDHLVSASELARRLDLPYHSPDVARVLSDKRLQRATLHAHGVPGPLYWALEGGLCEAELVAFTKQVSYPCVLKPALASGSVIRIAQQPADLVSAVLDGPEDEGYLVEALMPDDPCCPPWIASYLSCESVIDGADVTHVAITGRFPLADPCRKTGNIVPALLPAGTEMTDLTDLVDQVIQALSISIGVIHTEIKLTPDGPRLIEVNGRLGGRPPFVLGSISEVNLSQAAILLAAGARPGLDAPARCRQVGYWLMVQPPVWAEAVESVEGLRSVAALPSIDSVASFVRAGDHVDWRRGIAARVAMVRGRCDDHGSLEREVAAIRSLLRIQYRS